MKSICYRCKGRGRVHDFDSPWWKFWEPPIICPICDGTGRPPMPKERLNGPPPPPPPRAVLWPRPSKHTKDSDTDKTDIDFKDFWEFLIHRAENNGAWWLDGWLEDQLDYYLELRKENE